ncbi:MAG: hypothetical protein RR501_12300, partial [Cloacibacillus sp.]
RSIIKQIATCILITLIVLFLLALHDLAELKKSAQPLVDYINAHFDSHTKILVENDFVMLR